MDFAFSFFLVHAYIASVYQCNIG